MNDETFKNTIICANHIILTRHIKRQDKIEALELCGAVFSEATGRHNDQTIANVDKYYDEFRSCISAVAKDNELCDILSYLIDEHAKSSKQPEEWIKHASNLKIYRHIDARNISNIEKYINKYIVNNFSR